MDSFFSLWEEVKKECQANVSETIYDVWLKDMEFVSFENGMVTLTIAEFKRKIIEKMFMEMLHNAFKKVFGFDVEIEFLDSDLQAPKQEQKKQAFHASSAENTFETFVVGSSNKFAHAAALAVAANPGGAYNPLFVYGNSGLGKTHLLSAICHEIQQNNPDMNIIYTRGEDFTNELVDHINKKSTSVFHDKYRNADVLLVDDIQFIAGKEQTQEEFFHTFNTLTQMGNQIVLSSDRPPKEISTLEERLRTRFEWGLLADIQPPDLETRMAIIKRKADVLQIDLPDDVVLFIAEKLKSNIRQLEGAVKKMQAYISLHGAAANISTAQHAIRDILNDDQPPVITVEKIINEVARTYNVDPTDIRSKKQDANTSKYRQISMYIVSEMTGLSTKAIGQEFGGKDHSTVLYALNKIRGEIERNASTKNTIEDIIKNVREGRS